MLELSPDNAVDYLRARHWIGPRSGRVEALGWGVSNAVLRVVTADRTFVVKQSRPQLRTKDAWFSDLDRVYREQEVMEVLHPLLPGVVPEVLHVDRENYVFAMSHAPQGARVWKETLLAGQVDRAIGDACGHALGKIHEWTATHPQEVERFRDHTVFVQLRVDPFYRRIQERKPEVAAAVQPIIDRLLSVKEGLCHGDYSPKNILTHETGFMLVDYETAHQGDPTMDLGFFLSHLLLKAIKRHAQRPEFFELTRAFWNGYAAEVGYRDLASLQAHGIEHLAVCMLARIDGTSPVDYLPDELRRDAVRRVGRRILWEKPKHWDDVLDMLNREMIGIEQ
jgi:5-methylthioribose kinase